MAWYSVPPHPSSWASGSGQGLESCPLTQALSPGNHVLRPDLLFPGPAGLALTETPASLCSPTQHVELWTHQDSSPRSLAFGGLAGTLPSSAEAQPGVLLCSPGDTFLPVSLPQRDTTWENHGPQDARRQLTLARSRDREHRAPPLAQFLCPEKTPNISLPTEPCLAPGWPPSPRKIGGEPQFLAPQLLCLCPGGRGHSLLSGCRQTGPHLHPLNSDTRDLMTAVVTRPAPSGSPSPATPGLGPLPRFSLQGHSRLRPRRSKHSSAPPCFLPPHRPLNPAGASGLSILSAPHSWLSLGTPVFPPAVLQEAVFLGLRAGWHYSGRPGSPQSLQTHGFRPDDFSAPTGPSWVPILRHSLTCRDPPSPPCPPHCTPSLSPESLNLASETY